MRKFVALIPLSLLIPMCYAGSGGYSNDTSDMIAVSQGSAVTARAINASTNWYNPAGLSFLDNQNVALSGLYEGVKFSLDSVVGRNIDAEKGDYFIPSLFYSNTIGDWALGIGLNAPYGLSTKWDDPVTKYVATKTELTMLNLNPNVSYKISNSFSLAFGLSYQTATGEMGRLINQTYLNTYLNTVITGGNALMISPDAQSKIDGDDTAIGWNTAMMYKIDDSTQLGISYRNKTRFDLDGKAKITGLTGYSAAVFGGSSYNTEAELAIYVPSTLDGGISKKITEKTTVEFDIEWAQWSAVEEMNVKYSESNPIRSSILNTGNPIEKDWKDTWNYSLGLEYKLNDQYTISGGTRYRPSPIPEKSLDPSIPSVDLYEISTGLGMKLNKGFLQFTADYIWGDRDVHNTVGNANGTSVDGNYSLDCRMFGISYFINY